MGHRSWPHSVTALSNELNSSQAIAVATSTPELLFVHSRSGTTVREAISIPSIITQLQFSHSLLYSGSADGYLRTHDPRTGMKKDSGESSTQAHPSGIQGMQISGNYVSTIGWGVRYVCTCVMRVLDSSSNSRTDIQDLFLIHSSKSGTSELCEHSRRSLSLLVPLSSTLFQGALQASLSPPARV
jgi:hypothetical protein